MTLFRIQFTAAATALALFACVRLAAFDMPPDISAELSDARAAWRLAETKTADMRDGKVRESDELDKLIDSRDKAYDDAILSFEKALKKDPRHPQALAEFGRFYLSRREFLIARSYLEEAWASAPEAPPFWRWTPRNWSVMEASASRVTPRLKQREAPVSPEHCGSRAERAFTAAEKADILRTLGGVAERAGETGSALAYYRAALLRYPNDPRNRISLAIGLCSVGNTADAVTLLEPWDRATATAAQPEPDDFPKDRQDILGLGLYTLALAKEELGWYDDALKLYRQAEQACRQGYASGNETGESARMAIARLEDRTDEFQESDDLHARQVEEYAKINVARRQANMPPLAAPKSDRLNFADALNFSSHAVSAKSQALRDSEFVTALSRLRFNEVKVKDVENTPGFALFQSAENSFQAGIACYSKFARPYYEMALCELQMHRYTTARNLLDAAALYNPNDIATLNLRGAVLLDLGQWEEAAAVFRKVVLLDGDNGAAHFGLGRALTALKTNEAVCSEALDSFSRATRLGVRDERMDSARSLTAKDGQVFAGRIIPDGRDWIVMEEGAAPFRITADEVEKVNDGPGLKQQARDMLVRYQHGEKPLRVTRLGGRKNFEEAPAVPITPGGTIFGR